MEVTHNQSKNRFELQLEGGLAMAEYRREGNRILFTHTEVPARHEGRGYGAAVVREALLWARDEGLEIVPLCSFVVTYLKRHPEFADVRE